MKNQDSFRYQFAFLGLGRMAELILRALLKAKIARPHQIIVTRRSPAQLKKIAQELKVAVSSDNRLAATQAQCLWIGVKPFQAQELLGQIADLLHPSQLIISMLAGVSVSFLRKHLPQTRKIIRIMPNTPALLGLGMTGIFFSKNISREDRAKVLKITEALGESHVVGQESQLDAVTGLSGSGPAFIYQLAQGLIAGGVASGLKRPAALKLTLQTMLGALGMLKTQAMNPEELIAQVVTPGGTTAAGLEVLQAGAASALLSQTVQAASKRACSLRVELEKAAPQSSSPLHTTQGSRRAKPSR